MTEVFKKADMPKGRLDFPMEIGPFQGGLTAEFTFKELGQVFLYMGIGTFVLYPWTSNIVLPGLSILGVMVYVASRLAPEAKPRMLVLDSWGIYWSRGRQRQRIGWDEVAEIKLIHKRRGDRTPERVLLRLYNARGKKRMEINLNDLERCGKTLLLALEERLRGLYEEKAAAYLDGRMEWSLKRMGRMVRIDGDGLKIAYPGKEEGKIFWSDLQRVEWVPGRLNFNKPDIGTHLAIRYDLGTILIDRFDRNIHILLYILRNLPETCETFEPFLFDDDQLALESADISFGKTFLVLMENVCIGGVGLVGIIHNVMLIWLESGGMVFYILRIIICCVMAILAWRKLRLVWQERAAIRRHINELKEKLGYCAA
ncbi:MAG: hypothetical protein ACYSYT_07380 [Planctomycetota bacterium]|jgi:hypothetical protein